MDVWKKYSSQDGGSDRVIPINGAWRSFEAIQFEPNKSFQKGGLSISLGGPFRMWASDGTEIAVASEMSKRLLAILLLSKDMRRARSSLIMLLWDEDKLDPRPNLRQLLKQTRDRLGPFADHLVADRGTVALVGVRDKTERIADRQMSFFEDAGIGTEDFEDWYRVERANFENAIPVERTVQHINALRPRPVVGLMPITVTSESHTVRALSEMLATNLREVLVWNSFVNFIDLRAASPPEGVDMELRTTITEVAGEMELSVGGYFQQTCRWSQTESWPLDAIGDLRARLVEFIHKVGAFIEKTVCRLASTPGADQRETALFVTFTRIFATTREDVDRAIAAIDAYEDPERRAQVFAFRAIARLIRRSEYRLHDAAEEADVIAKLIRAAEAEDPFELSVLSAAALYHVYVEPDEAKARDYSDCALDLAPFSTLAVHVRAALEMRFDRLDAAADYVDLMRRTGRYGPMRHYADANAVTLAYLKGDYAEAVALGRALLRWCPNFLPVLRHVVCALLETGDTDLAKSVLTDVKAHDPSFATEDMATDAYPAPSETGRARMIACLEQHHLLKADKG